MARWFIRLVMMKENESNLTLIDRGEKDTQTTRIKRLFGNVGLYTRKIEREK